jgi:hypothetical protein
MSLQIACVDNYSKFQLLMQAWTLPPLSYERRKDLTNTEFMLVKMEMTGKDF